MAAGLLSTPSCYQANKIKTDFIIFIVCFASFYVGFSSVRVYRSRGIQSVFIDCAAGISMFGVQFHLPSRSLVTSGLFVEIVRCTAHFHDRDSDFRLIESV